MERSSGTLSVEDELLSRRIIDHRRSTHGEAELFSLPGSDLYADFQLIPVDVDQRICVAGFQGERVDMMTPSACL